ncbi:hypothetical protein [Flindersiella endophytica]
MNAPDAILAEADYIGATADELGGKGTADKAAAGISQKVLFQRRGRTVLHADRLVLTNWFGTGDLTLTRSDVTVAEARFTKLYGRFVGGLLNAGKPLILTTAPVGVIYLLVNRREFMETTDDRAWEERLNGWRRT